MQSTRQSNPVEMDARGHIVIPSAIRKARGFGAHSLFVLYQDCDELRLVPGEIRPQRETRLYSNAEIAQALIDGAITPEGTEAARAGIRDLGLNPDDFSPNL
jgi:bifunctional DNA-binding transcriptional regulator/antitoxin component of YhaV-PrlF toxin-antitoxin module